jgi:hypothetical protein
MSAAEAQVETGRQGAREATLVDRLAMAIPLASLYVWLCVIYGTEAWKRVTPWLFGDELELTQLSRSIAATGHAARRGEAHSPDSLYTVITAPFWRIQDVATAYDAIKYFDVLVMTSVIFPTYFLARLVVGRRWALFAAAGAAMAPALAYSSWLVEETLAYPYAALALFLIAKALVTRRRPWMIAALLVSLAGIAVRGELMVLPLIFAFAALFMWWSSDAVRARRATWSVGDWVGAVLLVLGAIFVVSGLLSNHSQEWYAVTTIYKHRSWVMGNWAAGALAIGIGIVPLVCGIAALFRMPDERPSPALRAFRSVSVAGLVAFGLYTALKASYLSTVFATRVEERNLIYATPLLFVGTALVLERRRVNVKALWIATAYALYLVGYALFHAVGSPYEMGVQLYSDAIGFSILQQANRYIYLDTGQARLVLIGVLALGLLLLRLPNRFGGRPRVATALTGALAIGLLAWTLTGEIAAATATVSISRTQAQTLGYPLSWVDDVARGRPTLFMGQGVADQTPEWLLEFWNRSVTGVSSLDGTVKGPGPSGGPNLTAAGVLDWPQQYDYAVEDWPCIDFAGTYRQAHFYKAGGGYRTWHLVQLTRPNRLRAMCTGIYPDGWSGISDSTYFRFEHATSGWLKIVVSRRKWTGATGPSPVNILVGPMRINANHQPELTRGVKAEELTIDSRQTKVCWVRTPARQFGARVIVVNKFVPQEVDPAGSTDARVLGAEVSYRFFAKRPSGTRSTCK